MPVPMNDFQMHCLEITKRFLLTAVIVDDELDISKPTVAHGVLKTPNFNTDTSGDESDNHPPLRSIGIDQITSSFSRNGMVCGVISPETGGSESTLAKTLNRADIIILDWRLSRKNGYTALPLLQQILSEGSQHQLRLIAIYTGENDPKKILDEIADKIDATKTDEHEDAADHPSHTIDFGACRIVVYLKEGVNSVNKNSSRVVTEGQLSDRLIRDFADKVEGLLPSIVMTALTAVRKNVYRVLERFEAQMDPAFLTHRACLPQPQEAERHIVEQIASELHGIMDDAVTTDPSPAGIKAIQHWLSGRFENDGLSFNSNSSTKIEEVTKMLEQGIENMENPPLGRKKFQDLSHGFSGGAENSSELDLRLASMMCFRQVLDPQQRQLSMGTVIQLHESEKEEFLLCVTPKCDSVRLIKKTSFLFLPLSDPEKNVIQVQVVVPVGENKYRHMSISMKPSDWCMMDFKPDSEKKCVLAYLDQPRDAFIFTDEGNQKYRWTGELKPELSQSIAQKIAERMSRVALNQSEWLRRSERKS